MLSSSVSFVRKKVSLSTEKKMLCLYLLRLLPKVERVRLNPNDMSALEFGKLFPKIPNFQFPATISEMPPIIKTMFSSSRLEWYIQGKIAPLGKDLHNELSG